MRRSYLFPVSEELPVAIPAWMRRRAEAYARHPIVRRPLLRARFARFAGAQGYHHVLDVGTGGGHNAFAFARRCASVNAVDWRSHLLLLARRESARRRLSNLTLTEADPAALPFPDDSFDLVTSAAAIHHFAAASRALAEMVRVCRPGGTVALEDVVTSEQEVRARYHNRLERLRDRTHQRCLTLSQLVALLGGLGLWLRKLEVQESIRELSEWLAVAGPPTRRAERIRHLLQGSAEQDLSGLSVQAEDDTFLFIQQVAWVRAVKPD